MSEIAQQLAKYSVDLKYKDIDKEVVEAAKIRVIDAIACAMGALNDESVKIIYKALPKINISPFIGKKNEGSTIENSAFFNSYLIRFLDWNDTYLSLEPAHPSDNIGATISVASSLDQSGKEFLLATILAYEIQCRFCDMASLRARGWDHVNYILISSSISSSKLLDLDEEKTKQAINISLNNLSTRQNRAGKLSHWKAAAASNSCRNGVFAAILAKEGFTGPNQIFEGIYGFQNLVSGKFNFSIRKFGKGRNFKIKETYIKKHNAEYHSQSAVDACLELRNQIKKIEDIKKVVVETHEAGFTIIGDPEKWNPKNKETADHSMPYIVARALIDGEVTEEQYELEKIREKRVLDFMKKIFVVENKEFTKLYPKNGITNKVTIYLKNGKVISKRVDFPRGHPKNPMSIGEIKNKFYHLAKIENREEVFNFLLKIGKVDNIKEFFEFFN